MALGYEDVTQWSTTALTNGSSDSAINWVEHQPRASVNNSARSVMAALAKSRTMLNGTLVTGGSANAQIVTTPVAYGGVTPPTGLVMCVKIGPGLTNTASGLTLSVDGAAPSGVHNLLGQSPGPGEWLAGSFVTLVFDGTYWNMLTSLPGVFTAANVANGRFAYQSATACLLSPFNGSQIRINGAVYQIPSSGVSFPNTGVNVNGVLGANLGANTTYLAGVYLVGGVLTPIYSTAGHSTSATVGNVGTEIVAGNDAISLVGIVRTSAGAQFEDDNTLRGVRSWFNRSPAAISAIINTSGGSPTWIPISPSMSVVCFANEILDASVTGSMNLDTPTANLQVGISIDSAAPNAVTTVSCTNALYYVPMCSDFMSTMSEGLHTIVAQSQNSAGGANWAGAIYARVG